TRLVPPPPESLSLATGASAASVEPVKSARMVSKSLPIVSTNDDGSVTLNEQGGVHVHHALGVVAAPATSAGSPASAVNPAVDAVAVTVVPDSAKRLANASLVAADAVKVSGPPRKTPAEAEAVAVTELLPAPSTQLPTVAMPAPSVVCTAPVRLPPPE